MDLTGLSYLDLNGINHNGTVPSSVGNLVNLTYFDVSNNLFTGPLPPNPATLPQLTTVHRPFGHQPVPDWPNARFQFRSANGGLHRFR
jgi:hypothetical protein